MRKDAKRMLARCDVSVIVPTYNRLFYLKKCLKSLESLTFKNFEVIIVDDASSDGTTGFLNSYSEKWTYQKKLTKTGTFNFISLKKNLGPSAARNAGAAIARGEILAFTDDDCEVDNNWLKEIAEAFGKLAPDFIFGLTIYFRENYTGRFPERVVENQGGRWPMGNNMAFTQSAFKKLEGFDSSFDKFHNEDSELAIRSVSKNFKFARAESALVYHQKSVWSARALISSACNASVWPILKRKYHRHYKIFHPPLCGIFINPADYFFFLLLPILLPALLFRFILTGQNKLGLFFIKWPLLLFARRFYIWKEALKNRVLMI